MFEIDEEVYFIKYDLLNQENIVLRGNISRILEDRYYVYLNNKGSDMQVSKLMVFKTREDAEAML